MDGTKGNRISRAARFLSGGARATGGIVTNASSTDDAGGIDTPGEALDSILSSMAQDIQDLKVQVESLKKQFGSNEPDNKPPANVIKSLDIGVIKPLFKEYGDES